MSRGAGVVDAPHLYVEGRGTGPRVLALHGVGGGAYFFRGVASRLASRYEIVAADLPGTGRSTGASAAFTFEDWIAGLGTLVNGPRSSPAFLIGHSLGTILALELWRRWPGRVRGIIFVGGLPRAREMLRERLRARITAVRAEGSLAGWGAQISPGVFSRRSMDTRPETVALFERLLESQPVDAYLRSLELLIAADASDVVPTVTAPCASISGADDLYAPPDDVAAFLQQLPQQAESVVLPDVGHLPFFEAPEIFAADVGRVLDGWCRAADQL